MKPPTLKLIASILGVSRRGNLHTRHGNLSIHAFTGSAWKRARRVYTIRVWPWYPHTATLPEVIAVARPLARDAGFPVLAEAGRTMVRVMPDGSLHREGKAFYGPRKPLP